MGSKPLTADEAEFVGTLCEYVRANLESFRAAGARIDERYSGAAFRRRHEASVEEFRSARAMRFDDRLGEQVATDEPMYDDGFIRNLASSIVPERVGDRMAHAMTACASNQDDAALDTEQAEIVCVLTWLAWDEHANSIAPLVCEFQSMEWRFDPLYTDLNRRQLHKDRVDQSWVTLARKSLSLVKLRPATTSGMMPVVSDKGDAQELPHAERWLRDRAHVVAANLPLWRALIEVEEQGVRAQWKAERMLRVRDRKRDLRLDLEHHAELLPPKGKRKTYFREQLRQARDLPESVEQGLYMASMDAIERARTMFNGRPFTRSFAAWVEFLLLVILSESAGESERVSVLQSMSNEWPGRQRLLIDLKHNGVLEQLLKLDARAWVVAQASLSSDSGDRVAVRAVETGALPKEPIESTFCIPPESLGPRHVAALKVLLKEPPDGPQLSSATLAERITNRHSIAISASDLRKYVIPKLRPLLRANTKRGYQLRSDARAEAERLVVAAAAQ
jgi:hypothetical protein